MVSWRSARSPVGGVAEVVEFDPARDLAWITSPGVTARPVPVARRRFGFMGVDLPTCLQLEAAC